MQLAFPLLCQYFDSEFKEGGESEGTLPCKVFFHVFAKWVLPLPLHPWNGELRGRSQCAGTVCSDWLTNLTTDWLWKWLSFMPPVPSSPRLLPLPVSLSFPYFFCLSELIFFSILTHPHLPQQETRAEGRLLMLWGGERITHRETERAAEMKGMRIKQMERSVQKVMRPKESEQLKGVW